MMVNIVVLYATAQTGLPNKCVITTIQLYPNRTTLWLAVVAPDRVLSMCQIELNCNYAKLNCLKLPAFDI